jgi:hypothetical protein
MDELIKTAKQFTDYDLILEHVKLPEFPELRTKVLRLFLRYAKEKVPQPKLQEAVSIAVSLMQHALDVHEQVNNSDAQRRKQLTVLSTALAGRLLSGDRHDCAGRVRCQSDEDERVCQSKKHVADGGGIFAQQSRDEHPFVCSFHFLARQREPTVVFLRTCSLRRMRGACS